MQNKTAVGLTITGALIMGIGAGTAKEGSIVDGIVIAIVGVLFYVFSYSSFRKAMKKL